MLRRRLPHLAVLLALCVAGGASAKPDRVAQHGAAASGVTFVAPKAGARVSGTVRVRVRDGETMTTDGPFAEVKEQLAGFYLVECDSIERAIEYAARVPDAQFTDVEVRPVLDLRGMEM